MNRIGLTIVRKGSPLRRSLGGAKRKAAVRRAYGYDQHRYLRHSSTYSQLQQRRNLAAAITEKYHSIEKGMSLPLPRLAFGKVNLEELTALTRRYIAYFGEDAITANAAGAVKAYIRFNIDAGQDISDLPFTDGFLEFWNGLTFNPESGIVPMTRAAVLEAVSGTELEFFASRHSVRQFADDEVVPKELGCAVQVAMSAPAVCNREFCHVYTFRNRDKIAEILRVQGGARGFSHNVPCLAIVTSSLSSYWNAGQRNQVWIDGGSFSMAFLLGLHMQGLGAVPLNWAKDPQKDQALRQIVPLRDDESIIMLVGLGHLRNEFTVARSPRLPLNEFWTDEV